MLSLKPGWLSEQGNPNNSLKLLILKSSGERFWDEGERDWRDSVCKAQWEGEALPVGKRISSLCSRSSKKKQLVREAEKRFSESLKSQQTTVSQRPQEGNVPGGEISAETTRRRRTKKGLLCCIWKIDQAAFQKAVSERARGGNHVAKG